MNNEIKLYPMLDDSTSYIQENINKAASLGSDIFFCKGIYNISPIFIESNLNVYFEEGVIFKAITDENKFLDIKTRVAGIEMDWYPGIVNIIDKSNISLHGHLVIDGQGDYWWNKYWGKDMQSGMRKEYDSKGLRWACDYDCKRPRNLLIQNSKDININGLESKNSGFWNVHILYSKFITLNNVFINCDSLNSPSTDGIDIDSSNNINILNCITDCNDDSICIKSGRDSDGLRVNKPSYNILIKDCIIKKGFGITIGSEVSGGVYDVNIENILFKDTDCGFRIKSSKPRSGYIKNIYLNNINMTNVKYLFHMNLDWNPLYSYCELPKDYNQEIKPHYEALIKKISDDVPYTNVSNIFIENVSCINDLLYDGISRLFNISGYGNVPIKNVSFKNINVNCKEYGIIENVENFKLDNFKFTITEGHNSKNDSYDNR